MGGTAVISKDQNCACASNSQKTALSHTAASCYVYRGGRHSAAQVSRRHGVEQIMHKMAELLTEEYRGEYG
jgi:hypothetical protein